jgi:hypothetical protein
MEDTASNRTSFVARGLPSSNGSSTVAYLRYCCLPMAVVAFVSRSLPTNGSTCHNIRNDDVERQGVNWIRVA